MEELTNIELQCSKVIDKFLGHATCAEEFCKDLVELWIQFRSAQEKIKETWDKPYDRMLIADRLNGLITIEEFNKRWRELWRLDEIGSFSNVIDRVHSACMIFTSSPESEWEIDEQQLRLEVYTLFRDYRL